MPKRKQSNNCLPMPSSTFIPDLWTSHIFLAPNEYSSATIGIHSCLVRFYENEHFSKFFCHGIKMGVQTNDFICQLDNDEKNLNDKTQIDIERCIMIARLREYLQKNSEVFQNILNKIQGHLYEYMCENQAIPIPKTDVELIQQCDQQNQSARTLDQIYRMRRFQYHNNDNVRQSINIINLQNWIRSHCELFPNINPQLSIVPQLNIYLQTFLNNSFFIIQHPIPSIVTHSPLNKPLVTAKIYCRLLCLLDKENSAITIDDITPYVRRMTTSNSMEEPPIVYEQLKMNWKTYTIVTALNNRKSFYCADLSEIILRQTSTVSEDQKSSKLQIHFSPHIYFMEFHINVTIRFNNGLLPYHHCVIVKSAPFGLITNTSQTADLFAKVFIQDLKSWKSLITQLQPIATILDNSTSSTMTTDLTMDEIVNSIQRYFIHKTGIYPKDWVIPYIEKILKVACYNQGSLIETRGHDLLVKILAQIDFMAEHPVLSLFHDDGLFLSICDSDEVNQFLLKEREHHKASICAIRFGALSRLTNVKDIGVRVDLLEGSSTNIQHLTFDSLKLPFALGVFIIKIILNEALQYSTLLTILNKNVQNVLADTSKILEHYDSEKLREFCPHKEGYPSIWHCTHNQENNNNSNDSDLSPAPGRSPNSTIITTTNINADNISSDSYDFGLSTIEQTPISYVQSTSSLQPYYPRSQMTSASVESSYEYYSNVPQYVAAPQTNYISTYQPPIVIVVTNSNHSIMSDQDVVQLISNKLPECGQLIQSSSIHRINVDQTFNAPTPISKTISSNSQSLSPLFDDILNFENDCDYNK
ncbi:unnamed protein product [Rotaria sp. Silwood2]|nr:unnamed protein product [Rotaria sp. Silwood2]